MNWLSIILFPALLLVSVFFAFTGAADLPERVAIHFNASGAADAWADRSQYELFLGLSLVGSPSLLILLMAGLPRYTGGKGQVPNYEYWFAEEREGLTTGFLLRHACWLGCLTVAVVYGIHVSILRANAIVPPTLAIDRFLTMIAVYLFGLAWWTVTFVRHFQIVDRSD